MLEGPQWLIFTSISWTLINKNFTTCSPPCSSNFLLTPIPVVVYSPNFIRPTTVEYGNLAIGLWLNASKKCSASRPNHLFTSFWMHSTSVLSRQPFHHHRETRS